MVDVLSGVLSGGATGLGVDVNKEKPNVGHFFMALDPAAFRPLDDFKTRRRKANPESTFTARRATQGWKSSRRKAFHLVPRSLKR